MSESIKELLTCLDYLKKELHETTCETDAFQILRRINTLRATLENELRQGMGDE